MDKKLEVIERKQHQIISEIKLIDIDRAISTVNTELDATRHEVRKELACSLKRKAVKLAVGAAITAATGTKIL